MRAPTIAPTLTIIAMILTAIGVFLKKAAKINKTDKTLTPAIAQPTYFIGKIVVPITLMRAKTSMATTAPVNKISAICKYFFI